MTENLSQQRAILAIQSISKAIIDLDDKSLTQSLDLIPVDDLDTSTRNSLFYNFISLCAQYHNLHAGSLIFDKWELPYEANRGPVSNYVKLYLRPEYDPALLAFCRQIYRTYTFSECVSELMDLDENDNISVAGHKLVQVYGEQTLNTYKNLQQMANTRNNVVFDFLLDKIREINEFAPPPSYLLPTEVIPKESSVIIPDFPQIEITLPSDEELADLLLGGMSRFGLQSSDMIKAKNTLILKLSTSPLEEKIRLIEPIYRNKISDEIVQKDQRLFVLLGPVNPHTNSYDHSTSEEIQYGGPRMMLSGAYDFDDDGSSVPADWFIGYCQFFGCGQRIRRRYHAFRRPVPHGGWEGCYCSPDCIRQANEFVEGDQIIDAFLLDIFEEQVNRIGILDRIPDEEYDDYINGELDAQILNDEDLGFIQDHYEPGKIDLTRERKLIDLDDPVFSESRYLYEEKVEQYAPIQEVSNLEDFKFLLEDRSLLFIHQKNCRPCQQIEPVFQQLASEFPFITFGEADLNNAQLRALFRQMKINATPTFLYLESGDERSRYVGSDPNLVLKMLNQ